MLQFHVQQGIEKELAISTSCLQKVYTSLLTKGEGVRWQWI